MAYIAVGEHQLAVLQPEDFAFPNVAAVIIAVPGGKGYLTGGDIVRRFHHADEIILHTEIRIKVQHSGNPLRDGTGGENVNLAVGQRDRLFRCQNDIFIVGQHIDHFGRGSFHRIQDIVGGGVHGLAAGNHLAASQVIEQGLQTFTRCHSDKTIFLFRFRPNRRSWFTADAGFLHPAGVGMLDAHILHLDGFKLAVFDALGQSLDHWYGRGL